MKHLLTLLVALMAALSLSPGSQAQDSQTHPVLVVNRSGKVTLLYHPLKQYVGTGKPALLYFWVARYDECRDEVVRIQALHKKYKDRGLIVLGVPMDGEIDETTASLTELGISFPQLFDMDEVPSGDYGVDGIPYTLLLGPDGKVVARDLRGDDLEMAVQGCLGG